MSPTVGLILGTITFIIILITVITLFVKISAHSAGVGGLFGFLLVFHLNTPQNGMIWILVLTVLLSGTVMSARLYLNVHKPKEVYLGVLLGFVISFLSIVFFA